MFDLPVIDIEFVKKEIKGFPITKATGNDGLSVKILKHVCNINIVIDTLTYLYNLSLTTGVVPAAWKIARIQPIFKSGDKFQVCNYRPIAILPVLSKIIEKAVNKNLLEYLSEKRLLNPKQFGFRPNHSCETALICMVDELAMNVDKGYVNGLALIDLRKAFDMVDHRILISKLAKYGCSDKCLTWFKSYLNDRKQYVSMQNKKSNIMNVNTGVAQGSILGPLLFTVMINDLPTHISKGNVYYVRG